jgi:hypothetical protein
MSHPPHLTIVGPSRPSGIRNKLLRSLSADDLALLQPHLEVVQLERGDVMIAPQQPIRHVYFPEDSIGSRLCENAKLQPDPETFFRL